MNKDTGHVCCGCHQGEDTAPSEVERQYAALLSAVQAWKRARERYQNDPTVTGLEYGEASDSLVALTNAETEPTTVEDGLRLVAFHCWVDASLSATEATMAAWEDIVSRGAPKMLRHGMTLGRRPEIFISPKWLPTRAKR